MQKDCFTHGRVAIDVVAATTVNRLGCGAMRLCGGCAWGRHKDSGNANRVLRRALQPGANFFKTADGQGPEVNDSWIAQARYAVPSASLFLAWLLAKSSVMLLITATQSIENLEEKLRTAVVRDRWPVTPTFTKQPFFPCGRDTPDPTRLASQ